MSETLPGNLSLDRSRFTSLLPLLFFLFLSFGFFAPFFIQGKAFLAADTLYMYYPWKFYASQEFSPNNPLITDPVNALYPETYNKQLKTGKFSNWNPYVLTGVPSIYHVGMGHPGRFYPLKLLLHRILPTVIALNMLLFIHVFLMGYFMYLYLREIDVDWRGSLFGGTAYMFNGFAMVWLEFEFAVAISAFLPCLLICMEKYISRRRFLYAFVGALVLGMIGLMGHMQFILFVGLFMLLYLLFILIRAVHAEGSAAFVGSLLTCFTITTLGGMLISAIIILPFAELVSNSSRLGRDFGFQDLFDTLGRVPFRYLVTLVFPDFYGNPTLNFNLIPKLTTQEYMNYNELCLYMGVPTIFAFLGAFMDLRKSFTRFYLLMTALVVSLFAGTLIYYPFFKLFPIMNRTNPTRLIFLFVFVVSVAAGIGFGNLRNLSPKRKKIFLLISLVIISGTLFLAHYGNSQKLSVWFNHELFEPLNPRFTPMLNEIMKLRSFFSPVILKPVIIISLAFILFLAYIMVKSRVPSLVIFALLASLLSYDLISFGRNYNTRVSPEFIYPATPAIEFLKIQKRPFRVLQDTGRGLYVNTLVPFGLEEVGGYSSVYPERIHKLMSYVEFGDNSLTGRGFDRWVMFSNIHSPLYDMMNVRYLLTNPHIQLPPSKYKPVFRHDLAVYENTLAMPRAFVVHDHLVIKALHELLSYMGSAKYNPRREVLLEEEPPREYLQGMENPEYPPTVTIGRYEPDEIEITAELSTNGWLVLTDSYYPGWEVLVDGEKRAIFRANSNFRAVPLKPGKHMVIFSYRPASIRWGWFLTICGFILGISGVIASILIPGKRINSPAH